MSLDNTNSPSPLQAAESFRASWWLMNRIPLSVLRQAVILSGTFFLLAAANGLVLSFGPVGLTVSEWVVSLFTAASFLFFSIFILVAPIYSFLLFYRLATPTAETSDAPAYERLSYPVAEILLACKNDRDVVSGFLRSEFGRQICLRVGVYPEDLSDTIGDPVADDGLDDLGFSLEVEPAVTLPSLVAAIIKSDVRLTEAFFDQGVTEDVLLSAARWVARTDQHWRQQIRFWSPERLQAITPLTQNFAYGKAYTLEKFSRRSLSESVFLGVSSAETAFATDLEAVFNTLSRPRNANVLLVGSAAGGVGDIIAAVDTHLKAHEVPDNLEDRELYVLDTQALITAADNSKGQFEHLLGKLLSEATLAGNVVLVIENIVAFRHAANQLSVNLIGILERYLNHPDLPIIATSTPADYHKHLEGREIMSSLGTVLVHDVGSDTLLKLLGEVAVAGEGQAICTIGALTAVADGSRRLITDDQMPHAAIDLLLEILATHQDGFIDKQTVNSYLSEKTGVPTGEITSTERVALSELEENLQSRVIGQDPAVKAVASALRRNRSGVEDQDRPIGTFLFLGPTGVGKTETAKTLDRVYFQESGLRRLDMSEYSQADSIRDLRGETGTSGRLANIVREKPYGVLLLDEFEKAHRQVHDLFLQILDEGYFTDGRGRRVSLDNMIIIATSNAGAKEIFSYVEAGDNLQDRQKDIIDSMVADGEFRPELINRFDATVIFHPLTVDDLIKITKILLDELRERMKDKGFRLDIGDEVASYLVEQGYDPEFGARAIRRVIQDTVENTVADKIINKGLTPGDKINLTVDDLPDT